jgi:hypothetical protein
MSAYLLSPDLPESKEVIKKGIVAKNRFQTRKSEK